jgi:hypothetical protein
VIQITASKASLAAYSLQEQVYTVRVGRKNAWILAAIMVLSTALPGLACLAPAPHQDCCKQMMMQDCGSSMEMADPACCKVHSSDQNAPPAQASRPAGASLPDHAFLFLKFDLAPVNNARSTPVTETPPRTTASGRVSILRI